MVQIGGIQVTAADDGQREFRADRRAPDTIAQLKELADLHERGALTDEEFETQRAKLLNE